MNRVFRVGSRDSVLAVRQAQIVMDTVKEKHPDIVFEHVTIKTTGDRILGKSLNKMGGKGLFIKELEQALSDGRIDLAVHSYKDMPYEEREDLPIVALSQRESPFDVLVLPQGITELEKSKPVGTSSKRRAIQFAKLHDDVELGPVRGNILTRLSKLDRGEYSALILAEAGLNRLDLQHRISHVFTLDEMIPSGSQGILAVQGRKEEDHSYLDCFHSRESGLVSKAERQFLKTLGLNCASPVAVYGRLQDDKLLLTGMYVDAFGKVKTGKILATTDEASCLGEILANKVRGRRAC